MHTKKMFLVLLLAAALVTGVAMSNSPGVIAAAPPLQTGEGDTDDSPAQETETQPQAAQSLMNVVASRDQLSDFATLIEAAGLANNLDDDGPFTIFAPTNAALTTLNEMADTTSATPTDILLYHIINGEYSGPQLANLSTIPTLLGEHIAISVVDGQLTLNDNVTVVTTDVAATNGVIHIVDAVLLPPENSLVTATQGSRNNTLDEVLANDGRFTTFLALAETAGLNMALADLGQTHTVFAPTDEAFEKLPAALMVDIEADPETFISYMLVSDRLGINQIATDSYIPTVEGRPLIVSLDDETSRVQINGQPLAQYNVLAANGIVHVANTVPIP